MVIQEQLTPDFEQQQDEQPSAIPAGSKTSGTRSEESLDSLPLEIVACVYPVHGQIIGRHLSEAMG
jgi:hypothetical protein